MKKINFFAFLLVMLVGCKDRYDLELKPSDKSLLVVEGVLNTGQGPTTIRLTQSVNLKDPAQIKPVLQAAVSVESANGTVYPLAESGNGNYTNNQLPLTIGEEYRLRIKIGSNKEYLSDFVEASQTPDIDSVTWERTQDGIAIYANTHDPSNSTRYYKWDFDETWEIRSYYAATYLYVGGVDIIPTGATVNYRCWKYGFSNTINIGTTAQLQSDVLTEAPVHFIPAGSERVSVRYSMLLRQQSLTKAAYEYFQLMKKNTESIGSIFDPQPSELKGNIKCISDPSEGVIGYLTASSFSEKRIFITSNEANWTYQQDCPSIEVANSPDSIASWVPSYLPWGALEIAPGVVTLYYMAPATCVDCTKRGGALNMPSYW
jgi:hypothetical protein